MDLIGRRVGACTILSLVGTGGMGEVYRARDTKLGREVAIKVLPKAVATDPDRRARLQREAWLLAALNHPHIATIYSLEEVDGVPALVLELVDGPTLAERLADGAMRLDDALRIASEIAQALETAHRSGIVHRDLKPANIKIATSGRVKVLDFGLAQAVDSTPPGDPSLTPTATALPSMVFAGTPAYMSPEQARGYPVDQRADVWAFGCVLFEMLTGRSAFGRATIADTIAVVLERDPEWSALPSEIPDAIRRLLQRCLEKDASHRLRDIAEADGAIADARRNPPPRPSEAGADVRSIAVLPFSNASGDPQMDYLSDGLTESIILSLSQLPQLRVMARGSVFRYKSRADDAQDVGRTLGVGAVATGRVMQRGDVLVVSAELLDVATGFQLWGAQYKRTVADIFATEEEIATEISRKLQLQLTPEKERLLGKRYTANVEAYHLYLKGKFHWAKRTEEGLKKGIQFFKDAIEVDPAYALAYAGLAEGYVPLAFYGHMPPHEALELAQAAARQAIAIDPTLSEARTVLAGHYWHVEFDFAAAERELLAILADDPNYARASQVLGEVCTLQGRFDEGIEYAQRARQLDPLSLAMNAQLALAYFYARRYADVLECCARGIEMEPRFFPSRWCAGLAYEQLGRFDEAIAEMQQARALSNDSTNMTTTLGGVYASAGRHELARGILAELEAASERKYVSPVLLAEVHAPLGEIDRALSLLERALEERDPRVALVKVDPRVDRLRGEARFQQLLTRLGLSAPEGSG